jgi:transcriptional regulator with XRE-family HTH domain
MNINEVQQQLFQLIKSRMPADASMADELAKLLEVSTDSAYRRMRGEKQITLEELYKLATAYKISIDQLMNIETGAFMFQGNLLNPKTYRYDAYLTNMMNLLALLNSYKEKEFFYLCKDTPIFHYFNSHAIAAFKFYFWMSTLIFFPEYKNRKVNFEEYPDEMIDLGKKILGLYNQMDSVEIWNIESWNSTFHQIDYYLDSQLFASDRDVLKIYDEMSRVLLHLEEQARFGYKFNLDDPEKKPMGKFRMYFNETVIQDNSMMVTLDNSKMAFMPHTSINFMMTRDMRYCDNYHNYVQNLMRRSTLISEVSEKERSRFFRRMRERLEKRKEALAV